MLVKMDDGIVIDVNPYLETLLGWKHSQWAYVLFNRRFETMEDLIVIHHCWDALHKLPPPDQTIPKTIKVNRDYKQASKAFQIASEMMAEAAII